MGKPGKSGFKQSHVPKVLVITPTGKRVMMTQEEYDKRKA